MNRDLFFLQMNRDLFFLYKITTRMQKTTSSCFRFEHGIFFRFITHQVCRYDFTFSLSQMHHDVSGGH